MVDELLEWLDLAPQNCFQASVAKAPGKLFLVGEYAVLEREQPAILFAVDHYLTCRIQLSLQVGEGYLSSNSKEMQDWAYQREAFTIEKEGNWRYVAAAVEVVEQLLKEMGRTVQDYQIRIESDLVDGDGVKYGFGSSGAVTVATVRALLQFYGFIPKHPLLIYKLAAIAMMRLDSNGSLADLAVNAFGGWVYYQAPDRQWLRQQAATDQLVALLLSDWSYLRIERLIYPADMTVLVGWTGKPASTDKMVHQLAVQDKERLAYRDFLARAKQVVAQVRVAFEQQDMLAMQAAVADYRHLLLKLEQQYHLTIETKELTALVTLAQAYQYAAKSSGAGGGDCGVAIGQQGQNAVALAQAWRQQGIKRIKVAVAPGWEAMNGTITNGAAER